jgi:hypothetical protein
MRGERHPVHGLFLVASLVAACLPAPGGQGPELSPIAPSPASTPGPTGPTRPFRPTRAPAPTFAVHVVQPGETLIALAERFETTPESLAYWNRARYPSLDPDGPGYRPDRIQAGWELTYLPGRVVDPEDLPPAATATPTGEPVSGPYPTLPPDGSAALVEHGPRGLGGVALTFEYAGGAGAGSDPEAVVQWLQLSDIPATVFVAPAAADAGDAAGGAVLRRLADAPGLDVGLIGGPGGAAITATGLAAGDRALAAQLGRSTAPFLRPAAGAATARELAAAGPAGWPWAIAWDVDPGDGEEPEAGGPIAIDIVTRVVSRARGGSIVRLQLDGPRILAALPGIIDGLAAAGLDVLPLDEVLGR